MFDPIIPHHGARLVGKRIKSSGIIQTTGKVMYVVGFYPVVFHSAFQRCPPPADTNTRIIQVADFIMGNVDTADVSRTDPHAPPVFIGHIGDQIIFNGNVRA